MSNKSLARIMYGTSQDYHPSATVSVSTLSVPSNIPGSDKPAAERESLGELLHKAWATLSGKH